MTTDRDDIASCPFCGESRFSRVRRYQFPPDDEGPTWKWGYHVICDASGIDGGHKGCGGSSAWGETEAEAIAAWNRRADELTALTAKVGMLTEALRPFSHAAGGVFTRNFNASDVLFLKSATASHAESKITAGDLFAARRALSEPEGP